MPVLAEVCFDVGATCDVIDLGDDQYELVFVVTNGSPEDNGIFYWVLNPGNAPHQWETIEWILPEGWYANHPGPQLHFFATNNGSGNPWRVYSSSAAACGATSLEFRWIFQNFGGPVPDCDYGLIDYTFHMQGVDPVTCENVGDSFVCPEPVPTDNTTWGQIKSIYDE
jgi:hypothetical protein